MAKKKSRAKASKKRSNFGFVKSKEFLFTAATMLALAVVVGFFSFAGGAKTKGRVFQWKQGPFVAMGPNGQLPAGNEDPNPHTMFRYEVKASNPDTAKYQQVFYGESKWGAKYYSVYTEITNPLIGSRSIAVGTSGEDVLALKQALKAIGEFKLTKAVNSNADNTVSIIPAKEAFATQYNATTWTNNTFDAATANYVNAVLSKSGLGSSYGDYLKDGKLDKYELARIFTLATDPGFIGGGTGIVFDSNTGVVLYNGAVKNTSEMDTTKWAYNSGAYSGQPAYRTGKGEKASAYYFTSGFWTQNTTPILYTRSVKDGMKGGDVKAVQSMLNYAKAKHAGDLTYSKLKLTGTYDKATAKAVEKYANYYQVPQSWANRRVMAMLARELNWGLY
jgi:hypothetical protein